MKQMHLYGFKNAGVGHTAVGLWRHPNNRASQYKDLAYWTQTARTLEAGRFDGLFIADFLGLADTYGGNADYAFREAIHVPVNDPCMAISAMAAVTEHLGFGVTISTTFEQPYSMARKLTTLDHLTKGRMGWNIVTSYQESAARNLGLEHFVEHDERYVIADEFMNVVYKLWEGSWEDDAVVVDRDQNIFADPTKIHPTNHRGKYFNVTDAFLCEPSIQRTPVLFQAGASTSGQAFGARHAEAVFLIETRPDAMRKVIAGSRQLVEKEGRDPQSVKFLGGISVVTGSSDAEAEDKFAEYINFVSEEGTLARQSSLMQVDFGGLDLDEPIAHVESQGIRYILERFTKGDPGRTWTPRQIAREIGKSLGGITIVGSATTIADKLEDLMEKTDLDGFNLCDYMPLECFPDFVKYVSPELQRRGRLRLQYDGTTLRENIAGANRTRLAEDHPGARFRRNSISSAPVHRDSSQALAAPPIASISSSN
jgi:long-chain alkane monooxygenase